MGIFVPAQNTPPGGKMKKVLVSLIVILLLVGCGSKEKSLFGKAERLVNKGEYAKAIPVYSQIIKNNPESYAAYAKRGLLYERLKSKDAEELKKNRRLAQRDYEQAISLNYQQAEIYNNLAALYIDENRNYDALLLLNQALSLRPNYLLALINRGVAESKMGDMSAALADFSRAEDLDKSSPLVYLNRGLAEYAAGYYASAAEDFSMLASLQPQNPRAYLERGRAMKKMEYYQNAVDDFHLAIAIRPDYAMPYFYIAQLLFSRSDIDQAIAYAQRSKELSPNYAPVYDLLGDILALDSPVEATQHYLAARRLDPDNANQYQHKISLMTTEKGRRRVVADRLLSIATN